MDKVLVANRGEIALRIIRACRELGLATVSVYSTADEDALHVRKAEEAVCIGPPRARDSYLNIPALIQAAKQTSADAIHPGYGFLAENAAFAAACEEEGIAFVGPSAAAIERMGDKALARRLARDAARGLALPRVVAVVHAVEGDVRHRSGRQGGPNGFSLFVTGIIVSAVQAAPLHVRRSVNSRSVQALGSAAVCMN